MSIYYIVSMVLLVLLGFLCVGSLLNLSNHPHWFIRGWDFPRVQLVVSAWILVAAYALVRQLGGDASVPPATAFLAMAILLTAWHGFRIIPYTVLLPKQSADTPQRLIADHRDDQHTIRAVMTNVEMENDQYERWISEMKDADPDLILVLEIDQAWLEATSQFIESYPYRVVEPQDNWYGMMLLSRLPLIDHQVRYLVQDDIPSIDAKIKLDDGSILRFVGVHPRPPEPIRGNDATARDAELTLWGLELANDKGLVIIGGDLNDVAWSQTTRLFLRTSGLLDPRRGRGFFNTFHADHWYMRFPLDHVFHSPHFTISKIERLGFVGSDHFPIQIDLRHTPQEFDEHDVFENKESDAEEIDTRIERAQQNEELTGEAL